MRGWNKKKQITIIKFFFNYPTVRAIGIIMHTGSEHRIKISKGIFIGRMVFHFVIQVSLLLNWFNYLSDNYKTIETKISRNWIYCTIFLCKKDVWRCVSIYNVPTILKHMCEFFVLKICIINYTIVLCENTITLSYYDWIFWLYIYPNIFQSFIIPGCFFYATIHIHICLLYTI